MHVKCYTSNFKYLSAMEKPPAIMEKNNGKIKQRWKGSKSLDTCFSVIFRCSDQGLISGWETGH